MQDTDQIFYRGQEHILAETPLSRLKPRPRFMAVSTANHRGYTAVFAVVAKRIYLVAASGLLEDGTGDWDAFPQFFPEVTAPVHIDWFSGELHLWSGRMIDPSEFDPVYEYEIVLEVERGVVVAERSTKNSPKCTAV